MRDSYTSRSSLLLPSPEMASEGGTACHVMLQGRLQTRNYPGSPEPCGTNVKLKAHCKHSHTLEFEVFKGFFSSLVMLYTSRLPAPRRLSRSPASTKAKVPIDDALRFRTSRTLAP